MDGVFKPVLTHAPAPATIGFGSGDSDLDSFAMSLYEQQSATEEPNKRREVFDALRTFREQRAVEKCAPGGAESNTQHSTAADVGTLAIRDVPWQSGAGAGLAVRVGGRAMTRAMHFQAEVDHFSTFLTPRAADAWIRRAALSEMKRVIVSAVGKHAQLELEPFGSFSTGTWTVTSDVDVGVSARGDRRFVVGRRLLQAVADAVRRSGRAERVLAIMHARVPLVKVVDRTTGLSLDFSQVGHNGTANTEYVQRRVQAMGDGAMVAALVRIVKCLLHARALDEPFSGGLGGYAVTLLVEAFLQQRAAHYDVAPVRAAAAAAADDAAADTCGGGGGGGDDDDAGGVAPTAAWAHLNPGSLACHLLQFLHFYGFVWDEQQVTLLLSEGGHFARRVAARAGDKRHRAAVCLTDPTNADNNVTRATSRYATVREAFAYAYHTARRLLLAERSDGEPAPRSLVQAIVRCDVGELMERRERADALVRRAGERALRASSAGGSSGVRVSEVGDGLAYKWLYANQSASERRDERSAFGGGRSRGGSSNRGGGSGRGGGGGGAGNGRRDGGKRRRGNDGRHGDRDSRPRAKKRAYERREPKFR